MQNMFFTDQDKNTWEYPHLSDLKKLSWSISIVLPVTLIYPYLPQGGACISLVITKSQACCRYCEPLLGLQIIEIILNHKMLQSKSLINKDTHCYLNITESVNIYSMKRVLAIHNERKSHSVLNHV